MGAARDGFMKFPKTQHLFGSKLAKADKMLSEMGSRRALSQKGVDYVWESKLDGSNVGLSFSIDGALKAQNRGHVLAHGEHPQYMVFRAWAGTFADQLRDVLGSRYLMFGEWCYAVHTIKYESLPHYFNEFDVYDMETEKFLSTEVRRGMLAGLVRAGILAQVPVVWPKEVKGYGDSGKLTLEAARKLMNTSPPLYGEGKSEGLYLKIECKGEVVGRYKLVREEFVQHVNDDVHWRDKAIVVQGLADGVDVFRPRGSQ